MGELSYNLTGLNVSDVNGSAGMLVNPDCSGAAPKAQELFLKQPIINTIILVGGGLITAIVISIYMEEIKYILTHFESHRRRSKTIWVLALYPVFAVTSLLGLLIPRAGTLVDLVANVYFATCLYQFVRLMVDYVGGSRKMWKALGKVDLNLRGPPCCCCCFCCPTVHFSPKLFRKLELVVLQVTIVRPLLMFSAAVLWANGSYLPGLVSLTNGFIYIATLNVISTLTAVYGLLLIQKTLDPIVAEYHLKGKFISIQMVLILSVIPNLIIGFLVTNGVIPCNDLLPSKTRGERIYHLILLCLTIPLSLSGRNFFRRKREGMKFIDSDNKGIMTSMFDLNRDDWDDIRHEDDGSERTYDNNEKKRLYPDVNENSHHEMATMTETGDKGREFGDVV